MADTITSSNTLTMGFRRPDGSLQKYTLENPKPNLTNASIQSAMGVVLDNIQGAEVPILMDSKDTSKAIKTKNGYSVGTAYRTETTTYDLDIS